MDFNDFIFFTGKKDEGEEQCLSNFYKSVMGWFPTNEHYYMFQKASFFNDVQSMLDLMNNSSRENIPPSEAKKIGRQIKGFSDEKWDPVKEKYMFQGLKMKFNSNNHLKTYLLSTGDKILVEAAPWDTYWGIGISKDDPNAIDPSKWKGKNRLGELLMKLRREYREIQ